MAEIGIRIKKRREELGLTQEELAKRLGYKSKTTIGKIETGVNDIIQSKVADFAKALDVSPAYLMGWENENSGETEMTDTEQRKIFARNLTRFLNDSGKTQREVAAAISVSPQTFNTWCQGIALPRMGKIQKLADYFGVDKAALIDDIPSSSKNSYNMTCKTKDETEIVSTYRKLNDYNQKKGKTYLKNLLTNQEMEDELALEAANARNPTPEQQKHADDIMHDPAEWGDDSGVELLAAHVRTDVPLTPEGLKHDLDLMKDPKYWD